MTFVDLLTDEEMLNSAMQNILKYVEYIYPGILSIYMYDFLNARTTNTTKAFLMKSFAISYIYNLFLLRACDKLNMGISMGGIRYNSILIIISFILPYSYYKFLNSKIFGNVCKKIGIYTSTIDVPYVLLKNSDDKYIYIKVYLNDSPYVYEGYLKEYEYEANRERFIILTKYKKYTIGKDSQEDLRKGDDHSNKRHYVYIKHNDIKAVEKVDSPIKS